MKQSRLLSRLVGVAVDRHDVPWRRDWSALVDDVLAADASAVSIDVFDTVVIRPLIGDRAWLSAMIAEQSDEHISATDQRRLLSKRMAPVGHTAPTLKQIYDNGESPLHADLSAAKEVDFESAQLRAVPGAVEALTRLREAGVKIWFTSDMHMSATSLRVILQELGLATSADEVLSSSDVGRSKSKGDLYPFLSSTSGADGPELHIGDNAWGDVTQALRNGLTALPFRSACPTRYEKAMSFQPGSVGPAIAGAARLARLGSFAHQGDERLLYELGTNVPGQTFTAFLLWIRTECERAGIRHVAFLSRDGELPMKMAEAMAPDHWDGFELSYLHVSRRVWQPAAIHPLGIDEWIAAGTKTENSFIHHYREQIPFHSLLDRLGLEPADLPTESPLSRCDPNAGLPNSLVPDWEVLLEDPAVRELIRQRAFPAHELLTNFLRQQGIGIRQLAMVDVGWTGRLAWMVSSLVREVAGNEPLHLHFGGDNVSDEVDDRVQIKRFALDDTRWPHPVSQPVPCVEVFTGSGKERLVQYLADEHGVVEPVFDNRVAEIDSSYRRACWDGAIATAASLPSRATLGAWGLSSYDCAEEVRRVFSLMWNRPDQSEVEAMRRLFVEADDVGESIGSFVSPFTLREILEARGGRRKWVNGSLLLTWRPYRTALAIFFRVRDRSS